MMYGVGLGPFVSAINENNLPFNIFLAGDTTVHGRGFLCLFANCLCIVGSEGILTSVYSDIEFYVDGYIIHSPWDMPPQQHKMFLAIPSQDN